MQIDLIPPIVYPLVIIGVFVILRKTVLRDNLIFNSMSIVLLLAFIAFKFYRMQERGYTPGALILVSVLFLVCLLIFFRRIFPQIRKK